MRLPLITILIVLAISLAVDWYIYSILIKRRKNKTCQRVHLYVSLALFLAIIISVSLPRRSGGDDAFMNIMWALYAYATILVPKVAFVLIDLIGTIPVLLHKTRLKFVTWTGVAIAVTIFSAMWWGALVNRFNIDIVEQDVEITGLPQSFDGYKIAVISDLHVGSYDKDTTFIEQSVAAINALGCDLAVFTGDIVNRRSDELEPFVSVLRGINASDGVCSVLGNHDYGDYVNWDNDSQKSANLEYLKKLQADMNWNLLLNETQMVYRGNDSIAIIGVENWGDPPFSVYGDLNVAYPALSDNTVKVLLSHNPAHWVAEVADNDSCNVALTISGHTHAMQVSMCGISPASLRYKTWGGRYDDKSKKHILYVNIGLGTVAIPTRIGATPEITQLTLRTKR